jgi:hypothetical protein
MPSHRFPQGKSEAPPVTHTIHVRPHFYNLQPRFEVHIIDNATGESLHHQILNVTSSVSPSLTQILKNWLHYKGYRRTGKFTRVNKDGLAFASAEFIPNHTITDVIPDSEVERMGVL